MLHAWGYNGLCENCHNNRNKISVTYKYIRTSSDQLKQNDYSCQQCLLLDLSECSEISPKREFGWIYDIYVVNNNVVIFKTGILSYCCKKKKNVGTRRQSSRPLNTHTWRSIIRNSLPLNNDCCRLCVEVSLKHTYYIC